MDINDIYKSSEALKAEDLNGKEYILTIKSVELRQFDDGAKPNISFVETDKTFVCNRTNTFTIAEWCGTDTDQWAGNKVIAFPTMTSFGSKMVDCIRFKNPNQSLSQQAQAPLQTQAQHQTGGMGGASLSDEIDDEIPFAPERRV